jgi:predicted lipoprotein with Yx(FWY)xxD motif
VSVKHVDGLGQVLVDASGKALYSPEQDTAKMIRCTGQCTTFWQPLVPGAGKPTAGSGAPSLGVVKRPDGMRQVTADGKPLYTFSQDSSSSITGDGFTDKFGGRTFMWHVVLAGGGAAKAPSPKSTPSSAGSYGY